MKKYLRIALCFSVIIVLSALAALAQSPSPAPVPAPVVPSVADVLLSVFGLVKSWSSLGLYAGIAAALKLLVDASKAFGLFGKIPAAFQSIFVVLLSVLTVGLTTLASGGTVATALAAALGSSGAAMLFHELLDDLLGLVKSKVSPPPAS